MCIMATSSTPHPHHRPLIDPDQLEAAGRRFRHWLDSFAHAPQPNTVADDIAWEDGEPHERVSPDAADPR